MKKTTLRSLSCVLALLLCLALCVISVGAQSAELGSLRVADASVDDEGAVGVVEWYHSSADGNYYLFLPASADKSALRLWFSAGEEVFCNGTALVSGEVTEIFAGGDAILSCGENAYHVIVLDGGTTGSVYINTESGSLDAVHADKEYKEPGTILVCDADGSVLYDGALSYIKGRGNSTWNGVKKPYNIKLDKKADLFGMGKAKKWCLLANASDPTLLRNQLSYSFAQSLGVDVTSDVVPVGLYVNGQYMGAYSITEKVEVGENRVDITDLEKLTEAVNEKELSAYALGGEQHTIQKSTYQYVKIPNDPGNITGGYLLELEKVYRYYDEHSGFISDRGQAIVVKSPENASKAQVEYIRGYYQEFEDALYSTTGYNALGRHYSEYADVASIARMYVAEEFAENFDGCSSSFYLYKDVDGLITAGPAWDFDLTFSNNSRMNTLINRTTPIGNPESLYIQHCFIDNYDESHKSFLAQLFTHDDFQQTVQNIWNDTVTQAYPEFCANIDSFSAAVSSQAVMNAIRWNSYGTTNVNSIRTSYANRVNIIRSFASTRYSFLSNAYADDTYFVKYELGEDGGSLLFDTNIYREGDKATVKGAPEPKANAKHFLYFTLAPDGSGVRYNPGDTVTVSGNMTLYAHWADHTTVHMDDGTDTCSFCGVTYKDGVPIEDGWYRDSFFKNNVRLTGMQTVKAPDGSGPYLYAFDGNGVSQGKFNGIYKGFYYENGVIAKNKGVVDYQNNYYYIGMQGQVFTGASLYLNDTKTNGFFKAGTYYFNPDGSIILKEGIIDGYYYERGSVVMGKGVIDYQGNYYYIGKQGQVYKGSSLYMNASMTNGLLIAGTYYFNPDGSIILKEGIIDGYYYERGTVVKGKGVIDYQGNYYYIGQQGQVYKGKSLYMNTTMTNGLFKAGTYYFNPDGSIILKEGIIDGYYYERGSVVQGKGVIDYQGSYYYIGQQGQVYKGKSLYMNATMTNGLFKAGTYYFNPDGSIILKEGIVDGYYYERGTVVQGKGVIDYQGSYYYIGQQGQVYKGKSLYMNANMTNGLLTAGTYYFNPDGSIILKEGIVDGYYYERGTVVKGKGVIDYQGSYYYIGQQGQVFTGSKLYIGESVTNGLLSAGWYSFSSDGRIIL